MLGVASAIIFILKTGIKTIAVKINLFSKCHEKYIAPDQFQTHNMIVLHHM